MKNPFLQRPFPVSPSMNQVRIMDLPGMSLPAWVKGKRSFELLSSFALRQRVQAVADVLQLDPDDSQLLEKFDGCLTAVSPKIRTAAHKIAEDCGRSLAYHLLTLKRGDAINQQARPDWQPVHWAFWRQIEAVWLGGGLLSGNLGQTAVPLARQIIHQNGFPDFQLKLSPYGRHLPLLGVARTAPPEVQAMLVFDFGQTAVKRAVAQYHHSQLVAVKLLPSLPAPCEAVLVASQDEAEITQFAAGLLDLVAETWRETAVSQPDLSHTVGLSLACYLLDGQPRPEDVGCYGRMQHLSPNLQQFLKEGLCQRLNAPMSINLWHDGSAAGLTHASDLQTAVLTFGTAMGVGFAPSTLANLRPVSPTLIIQSIV